MPQQGSSPSIVVLVVVGDVSLLLDLLGLASRLPKYGVNVAAQRIIMSRRRGGTLSTHFVANRRMECKEDKSTCSA